MLLIDKKLPITIRKFEIELNSLIKTRVSLLPRMFCLMTKIEFLKLRAIRFNSSLSSPSQPGFSTGLYYIMGKKTKGRKKKEVESDPPHV